MRIGIATSMMHPHEPPFQGGVSATAWYTADMLAGYGHEIYLFHDSLNAPDGVIAIQQSHTGYSERSMAYWVWEQAAALGIEVLVNVSNNPYYVEYADTFPNIGLLVWLQPPPEDAPGLVEAIGLAQSRGVNNLAVVAQTPSQRQNYYNKTNIKFETFNVLVPLNPDVYYYELPPEPRAEYYFAWVGRPKWEKGIDTAFALARKGYNVKCLIGGGEDDPWLDILKKNYLPEIMSGKLSIEHNASPDRVLDVLNNATALLFLNRAVTFDERSWEEPGSRVLAEALLLGCPVIATENGCVKDWLTHGSNGYVGSTANGVDDVYDFIMSAEFRHDNAFRKFVKEWARVHWHPDKVQNSIINACYRLHRRVSDKLP